MFFRFSAALILIVIVSMAGVVLEKRTLELRRAVSRQYYQTDLLLEQHVRLRLETQRLTAPAQLEILQSRHLSQTDSASESSTKKRRRADEKESENTESTLPARLPLLRFQQPFNPEGIDR